MIIALLTDFGTKDYFVGAVKGAILSVNPEAKIVDITHEVLPQDIKSASFTLRACYKNFPPKTIFVAVVDPGVGSKRKAILVETENYFFVAPDNGLLSFVFENEKGFRVFETTDKRFFAPEVSRTFHGRDVFALVAAHLSNGVAANKFGSEIFDFVRLKTGKPVKISATESEAEIIHADKFGNLVTNLEAKDLPENFTLAVKGKVIEKRRDFYAEAARNEVFMILGSAGFLEIAANQNSAREILGVEAGDKILLNDGIQILVRKKN